MSPASPGFAASDDATSFLMNPAHDDSVQIKKFAAPLKLKWSHDFGYTVSYPLIVGNVVYVTTASLNGGYGTMLNAMSLANGSVLWQQPVNGTYFIANAAYDKGKIFVLNFDGDIAAFDAKTGAPGVTGHLGDEYDDSAPPVAAHGKVYADEEYEFYAFDEKTGTVAWTGSGSSYGVPMVGGKDIFVANEPSHQAFSKSGDLLWSRDKGSKPGVGAYYKGRIYSPGGVVLDAATGVSVMNLSSIDYPAAFWSDPDSNDYRIGIAGGKLTSTNVQTGADAWTFKGDAAFVTQPIAINGMIAVGSSASTLYLVDAATGNSVWSAKVPAGISGEQEGCCTHPWIAMAAGDGALVVPGGTTVSVYVPAKQK